MNMNAQKFSLKQFRAALAVLICFAVGILLTVPAKTHAAKTVTVAESVAAKNICGIVGVWREQNVPEPKLLTISADGTYQLLYGGGGVVYGTVKLTFDEHPDGSKSEWYTLYDGNGEFWIAFAKDKNPAEQTELRSGHDGATYFARADENIYHNTSAGVAADDYLGVWGCGRCTIDIAADGDNYVVDINWASSAAEGSNWTYHCAYNAHCAILICNGGGVREDYVFTEDGAETFDRKYSDGYATFVLREGTLTWLDRKENVGDSMIFLNSPPN
ncbi:MAG: hypothetical protein IJG32_00405 [Selenomonadaceae bacterium]|nr:hypothetical protein [Selenomonadaceae bacterium]